MAAVLGTIGSTSSLPSEKREVRDGHIERDGIRYAVKRVPLGSPGDPSVARLRGQVLLLAQSKPAGFPTIRNFTAHETLAEVVMDERRGIPLAVRVQQQRLTADEVLEVALDIGHALEQLHELGERHGAVGLDSIVAADEGGWCLRDYGECFASESSKRASSQRADSTVSGHDLWVDLLGLGKVLQTCLGLLPPGEGDGRLKLAGLAATLANPSSSTRAHAGIAGFVRELESTFTRNRRVSAHRLVERVARMDELERLRRIHGSWSGFATVVFRGGPGTGKTHLIRAFREVLRQQDVLHAICRNWEMSRFGVVRQLIEGAICERGVLAPDRLRDLLELAGDLARFLRPISPLLADAIPAGGRVPEAEASDEVYVEALAEVLVRRLQRANQVVILDDIQWLDEASRKVLSRVFQRDGLRIFLVCNTRDDVNDGLQAQRLLAAVERTVVWDHQLGVLDAEQASRVVSQYLSALGIAPEHAHALAMLGDGTPLSALEVVRSVLEAGLLLPGWNAWKPDMVGIGQLRLPTRTTELLSKRLNGLAPECVAVLRLAAVLGGAFDARVVEAATQPGPERLREALQDAHQFALLERTGQHSYRFVHQCVRDALSAPLNERELQQIHTRIVHAMRHVYGDAVEVMESAVVFQLAHHSRQAGDGGDRDFAFAANVEAGRRAIATFDNRSALSFLIFAESIGTDEQREASGILGQIAEAHLLLGDLEASLRGFSAELERLESPIDRAHVWSRLATIHEARYDSKMAFDCLGRAFDELGEPQPRMNVRNAWRLFVALLSSKRTVSPSKLEPKERARTELLCTLYFQTNRLAVATSQIATVLDVSARCIRAAERLGPSQALSKAYTFKGFLLASFGRREAAARVTREALEIARQIDDPPATAHVLVNQAGVVCWQGDTNRGLELGAEAIERYHNWMIPSELAIIVFNQDLLETVRGSGLDGLRWLSQWASRSLKSEGPQLISEFMPLRLAAAALHLGVEAAHAREVRLLEARSLRVPEGSAYYCWTHGPRVRVFTETGDVGDAFERYVKRVEEEQHDPRKVHLVMVEYYVAVAHARAHQCFRSTAPDQERLDKLKRAARDLRLAARVPLAAAHAVVIDATILLFQGKLRKAERLFDEAERLGGEHGAPWVVYAAARGRAHLHRRCGRLGAAREQARFAEHVARSNGAVHRARWIREEFQLVSPEQAAPVSDAERPRRQMQALVRITKASSRELDPDRQARLVLDELIEALSAERGYLFQRSDPGSRHSTTTSIAELRPIAARSSSRTDVTLTSFAHHSALEAGLTSRDVQVIRAPGDEETAVSILVAPLIVQQTILGAVCLESAQGAAPFTEADGEVLRALAGQVPMALELAHALRDRERLAEDLRHSQKMEALGRLAGGVAHDFNNMLSAIRVSVDSMLAESLPSDPHHPDLETIQQASDRASTLTRQLLTFSRREGFDAQPIDVNVAVRGVVPMLKRLLGHEIGIRVETAEDLFSVKADAAQLEQVLVNLSVNAWDAMRDGGQLTIRTRNERLRDGEGSVLLAGEYAVLEVSDDGHGMDEDTRRRVFEPFFTTKAAGSGTGLGMAIVYGIVRQNGGHIDIQSGVGKGTDITIYLPRTHERPLTVPAVSFVRRTLTRGRVLFVDDEPLVRRPFARVLRDLGCEVMIASGAAEAIHLLGAMPQVDLIITDVIMPDMNGVQLIERLWDMGVRAKVLYVSGFADGVLTRRVGLGDRVDFMPKPLGAEQLGAKVREMLSDNTLTQFGTNS